MKMTPRLKDIALLRDLDETRRTFVLEQTRYRRVMRGERLVKQGETGDKFYNVLRGKFDVLRDGCHLIAEIGAGEPVGEITFFAGSPRTADVVAARDSDILELDRKGWEAIISRMPDFGATVIRSLALRLAAATATAPTLAPKVPTVIGLSPAAGESLPHALVYQLLAALGESGPIKALRVSDLPASVTPDHASALSSWLVQQEEESERLLIIAGEGNAAWDRAALRHCDHLILCGRLARVSGSPAEPSELETYVQPLFRARQCSLVLWRKRSDEPIVDTAKWLAGREVHLHHHVALDAPRDFARLGRFVSGKASGAVFGGGGAFGAAHIGALRALYGAGVTFDFAGGTSIGSTVAVATAAGDTPSDMLEMFESTTVHQRVMGRLTWPRHGLFDPHHTDTVFQRVYAGRQMEDLPVNAYTVATNISTGELDVRRRGPIWSAVRASTSLPGAMPPWITEHGEMVVDGALLENVPISVMRGLKNGPNVIFALSPSEVWRIKSRYSDIPGRWKLAGQTLARRKDLTDLPRLIEVLGRSMMVTSDRRFRDAGPGEDLLLELPNMPEMSLLSFKLAREQEAMGYEYTARLIDTLGGPEGLKTWQQRSGV
jgi:NTE family protein